MRPLRLRPLRLRPLRLRCYACRSCFLRQCRFGSSEFAGGKSQSRTPVMPCIGKQGRNRTAARAGRVVVGPARPCGRFGGRGRITGSEQILNRLSGIVFSINAQVLVGHLEAARFLRPNLDRPLRRADQRNVALQRRARAAAQAVNRIDAAEDKGCDTADAEQPPIDNGYPARFAWFVVFEVVVVDHRISSAGVTPNRTRPEAMTVATAFTSASRARVNGRSSGRTNRNSGSSRPRFQCA